MGIFKVNSWKDVLIHLVLMIGITFLLGYLVLYVWLPSYTKHGQKIEVPLLENLTVSEAKKALEEKNLRLEVQDTIYKIRYAPGAITRQEPTAESFVKENRRVYVTINSFKVPTITVTTEMMEYLEDYTLGSTKSKIIEYGFKVGKPFKVSGPHKNHVNHTFYKGDTLQVGMPIPLGSKIDIEIQRGE